MIKNIIFDLADVIMGSYYGVENQLKEYNISPKEFLYRKQQSIDFFLDTMRGKYSEEEYLRYLIHGTNWSITVEQLKKIIRDNLNYTDEKTMNIIKKLKNRYYLILLSDHVKEWITDIFKYNPDLKLFDSIYFSYSLGKIKHDKGTFRYVLEDLVINPSETIFINDSEKNIESANKEGIEGIIFKNAEQLEEELKKKNILI